MTFRKDGHDGNREWACTANAVGNVRVGWGETPEKLGGRKARWNKVPRLQL